VSRRWDALPAFYTLPCTKRVWARKMNHSEQSAQPERSVQIPAPDQRRAAGSSRKAAARTRRMRSQANLLLEPQKTSLGRKSRTRRERKATLSYALEFEGKIWPLGVCIPLCGASRCAAHPVVRRIPLCGASRCAACSSRRRGILQAYCIPVRLRRRKNEGQALPICMNLHMAGDG
jgi:hypothetical protein